MNEGFTDGCVVGNIVGCVEGQFVGCDEGRTIGRLVG